MSKKSRIGVILKYVVPLVISVGLCYLLFTGIDFNEMLEIIRQQCSIGWILFGMALSICSFICRAYRWDIQLRAIGITAPKYALVYSIFGTYAVNLVFPRLGEVWRTGYISQRQQAPFTSVFGSMVADRLADTVAVALMSIATFFMASGAIGNFLNANMSGFESIVNILLSPWLWGAVVILVGGFWWLMRCNTNIAWVVKLQSVFRELWQGFAAIATMHGKGRWLVLTIGIWLCFYMSMYVEMMAFPFTKEVIMTNGWIAAMVTFVIGSLSMGVPSNGGIGPWQWAVIFALGIYGVESTSAAAFANLVLGCQTLMYIILGIITFAGIALEKRKNIT